MLEKSGAKGTVKCTSQVSRGHTSHVWMACHSKSTAWAGLPSFKRDLDFAISVIMSSGLVVAGGVTSSGFLPTFRGMSVDAEARELVMAAL